MPPMGNGPSEQPITKPNPDPTYATLAAVEQASKSERDYVDGKFEVLLERLRGMDTATNLLSETAKHMPQDISEAITHLRELQEERLISVATQFKERDTRSEREARDNKLAVDAAFAAQEKQAVAQQESNAARIDKSELATTETIKTNQELSRSTTDALTKNLDEVKLAISRLDATKAGNAENRQQQHASTTQIATIVGAIVGLLGVVIVLSNVLTGA